MIQLMWNSPPNAYLHPCRWKLHQRKPCYAGSRCTQFFTYGRMNGEKRFWFLIHCFFILHFCFGKFNLHTLVSLIQYVVIDKYILGILHSTFIGHSKNMARFLIAFAALFAYANAFCFHAPGKVIDTKYYKEKSYVLSKGIKFLCKRD